MQAERVQIRHPNTRDTHCSPCHTRPEYRRCEVSDSSMLTRRNMLVLISILPAEIITRIFNAFSEQPYSLGWMPVTHVCRRWHQIALDDSTLWTHFSAHLRNKGRIAERLCCARNAPHIIELCGSLGKNTFSLFLPHISHTHGLCLRNLSFFNSEIIQEISIQKAPSLERLELSMSNNTSPMGIDGLVLQGAASELTYLLRLSNLLPLVTCSSWPTNTAKRHSHRRGAHRGL